MKTVKSSFKVSGAGLMFAAPVELTINPADKKGIRFFIEYGMVEAKIENVVDAAEDTNKNNGQSSKDVVKKESDEEEREEVKEVAENVEVEETTEA